MSVDNERSPLGYCEAPISDFDDITEVLVVKGRTSRVKVGKLGKIKQINPETRILSVEGTNIAVPGGSNEPLSVDEVNQFLPVALKKQVASALDKNRQDRKSKLQRINVIK